jgi:transcriptional regulator with XRE-family HTH domain
MSIKIASMDQEVMSATRLLRLSLGDSQQSFGIRLGLSTISVARYERSRAPRGRILAKLAEIAAGQGLNQLEDTFRRALSDEFGGLPPTESLLEPIDPGEKDLVLALLGILRNPQYRKEAEEVQRILKPIAQKRKEDADFLEARQRGRTAITKLLHKGYAVDAVTTRMGEPIEKIAEALFHSADLELIKRRGPEVLELLEKNGWTIERVFQQFGQGLGGVQLRDALGMSGVQGQPQKEESRRKG